MYQIGDKIKIWWRGQYETGWITEKVHGHCYYVKLWTGEVAYRLESDIEK